MPTQLIADCGATKCEWCITGNSETKTVFTKGLSPYFLTASEIVALLQQELMPGLKQQNLEEVHFYGTGLANPANAQVMNDALHEVFPAAAIKVETDLLGAARALCGRMQGIACILGTGSNSCYYDGERIAKSNPSLGYILGDEGSGAYLGKKVLQYYLNNTFDEELKSIFARRFEVGQMQILDQIYRQPLPNRYLAGFAVFLSENRGHYMIENILEDGVNDFFLNQVYKYAESWTTPLNFTGSIAYVFKDVLQDLCSSYELELGNVLKAPMKGLIKWHNEKV